MRLLTPGQLWNLSPEKSHEQYLFQYFSHMLKQGTPSSIVNVHSEIFFIELKHCIIPVTLADPQQENCYVCSPYAHYVSYAKEEVQLLSSAILRFISYRILNLLSGFLKKTQFNNVVILNNWFLSTNLYPPINRQELEEMRDLLQREFPGCTILMRSLNKKTNAGLMQDAEHLGFKKAASRQVYLTDPATPDYRKRQSFKLDSKLLRKTPYQLMDHEDFTRQDIPRILELYNDLYLDKYSRLNPQFTQSFIAGALEHKTLHLKGLRYQGRIDGVLGYFCRNGVMTTPLFGYDRSLSPKAGLYRLLSNMLVLESEDKGHILNQSSGVGEFKRNRGCSKYIEYIFFYNDHLPGKQRKGWNRLASLVNRCYRPLLEKKDF